MRASSSRTVFLVVLCAATAVAPRTIGATSVAPRVGRRILDSVAPAPAPGPPLPLAPAPGLTPAPAPALDGRATLDKRFVIVGTPESKTGRVSRDMLDRACDGIADVFHCQTRWTSGATGQFIGDVSTLTVGDVLDDLRHASQGVKWSLIGDNRFDARTSGARTTLVADASSTSTFALETTFNPFGEGGACLEPCEQIECSLGENQVKVQRAAPAHLLQLIDYGNGGVSDHTLRFTSMGTDVDVYVVDGNVFANDEFNDLVGGTTRLSVDAFRSDAAAGNKEFACSADHGTHVASLVAGVSYGPAKNATVIPVSVQPGCGMSGRVSDLAQGLSWIADRLESSDRPRPSVVTMSLQLPRDDPASIVIDTLVADLIELGAIVVAAAGNYRADACNFSPSGLPDVITVGALDSRLPWTDSNSGACVDVWAAGVSIVGASPSCFKCTSAFTGTSQAAPIVAGVIATRLQSSAASTHSEIRDWLIDNAVTLDNVPGNATYKAARMARDWSFF